MVGATPTSTVNIAAVFSGSSQGMETALNRMNKGFGNTQRSIAGLVGAISFAGLIRQISQLSSEAVKFDRIASGYEALAQRMGFSTQQMLADVREFTQGQISTVESIASINKAITLIPASAEHMKELTVIATGAAAALGLDVKDAFDDILTGLGRASPKILDNLGIIINSREAYRAYRIEIGRVTGELTAEEKQLALLNQVLEKNTERFGLIAASVRPDVFQQTAAAMKDLQIELGKIGSANMKPFLAFVRGLIGAGNDIKTAAEVIAFAVEILVATGLTIASLRLAAAIGTWKLPFIEAGKAIADTAAEIKALKAVSVGLGAGLPAGGALPPAFQSQAIPAGVQEEIRAVEQLRVRYDALSNSLLRQLSLRERYAGVSNTMLIHLEEQSYLTGQSTEEFLEEAIAIDTNNYRRAQYQHALEIGIANAEAARSTNEIFRQTELDLAAAEIKLRIATASRTAQQEIALKVQNAQRMAMFKSIGLSLALSAAIFVTIHTIRKWNQQLEAASENADNAVDAVRTLTANLEKLNKAKADFDIGELTLLERKDAFSETREGLAEAGERFKDDFEKVLAKSDEIANKFQEFKLAVSVDDFELATKLMAELRIDAARFDLERGAVLRNIFTSNTRQARAQAEINIAQRRNVRILIRQNSEVDEQIDAFFDLADAVDVAGKKLRDILDDLEDINVLAQFKFENIAGFRELELYEAELANAEAAIPKLVSANEDLAVSIQEAADKYAGLGDVEGTLSSLQSETDALVKEKIALISAISFLDSKLVDVFAKASPFNVPTLRGFMGNAEVKRLDAAIESLEIELTAVESDLSIATTAQDAFASSADLAATDLAGFKTQLVANEAELSRYVNIMNEHAKLSEARLDRLAEQYNDTQALVNTKSNLDLWEDQEESIDALTSATDTWRSSVEDLAESTRRDLIDAFDLIGVEAGTAEDTVNWLTESSMAAASELGTTISDAMLTAIVMMDEAFVDSNEKINMLLRLAEAYALALQFMRDIGPPPPPPPSRTGGGRQFDPVEEAKKLVAEFRAAQDLINEQLRLEATTGAEANEAIANAVRDFYFDMFEKVGDISREESQRIADIFSDTFFEELGISAAEFEADARSAIRVLRDMGIAFERMQEGLQDDLAFADFRTNVRSAEGVLSDLEQQMASVVDQRRLLTAAIEESKEYGFGLIVDGASLEDVRAVGEYISELARQRDLLGEEEIIIHIGIANEKLQEELDIVASQLAEELEFIANHQARLTALAFDATPAERLLTEIAGADKALEAMVEHYKELTDLAEEKGLTPTIKAAITAQREEMDAAKTELQLLQDELGVAFKQEALDLDKALLTVAQSFEKAMQNAMLALTNSIISGDIGQQWQVAFSVLAAYVQKQFEMAIAQVKKQDTASGQAQMASLASAAGWWGAAIAVVSAIVGSALTQRAAEDLGEPIEVKVVNPITIKTPAATRALMGSYGTVFGSRMWDLIERGGLVRP